MADYFCGLGSLSLVVRIGEKQVRHTTGLMMVVPETVNVRFGFQGGFAPNQFSTNDEALIKALDASPFNMANKGKTQGLFWRVDGQKQVSPIERNKAHVEQDLIIARAKQMGISQKTPELDINELRAQVRDSIPKEEPKLVMPEVPLARNEESPKPEIPQASEAQPKRRGRPKAS